MKHPIDCEKYSYIEVYWNKRWHLCKYEGWEPITETDFRQPKRGAKYTIVYHAIPQHFSKNYFTNDLWTDIHQSRVRPYKGKV